MSDTKTVVFTDEGHNYRITKRGNSYGLERYSVWDEAWRMYYSDTRALIHELGRRCEAESAAMRCAEALDKFYPESGDEDGCDFCDITCLEHDTTCPVRFAREALAARGES